MPSLKDRLHHFEAVLEIQSSRGRYCDPFDSARWDEFVALFISDGVFEGLAEVESHAALMKFFSVDVPQAAEQFWYFYQWNSNGRWDQAAAGSRWSTSIKRYLVHLDRPLQRLDGAYAEGRKWKSRRITFYFYSPVREGFSVSRPPSDCGLPLVNQHEVCQSLIVAARNRRCGINLDER